MKFQKNPKSSSGAWVGNHFGRPTVAYLVDTFPTEVADFIRGPQDRRRSHPASARQTLPLFLYIAARASSRSSWILDVFDSHEIRTRPSVIPISRLLFSKAAVGHGGGMRDHVSTPPRDSAGEHTRTFSNIFLALEAIQSRM